MSIISIQECQTLGGWTSVLVQSETSLDTFYEVTVCPYVTIHEFVCSCPAFEHSKIGQCKHQEKALEGCCFWSELTGISQNEEQRRNKICPQCGGPTNWSMEYVED